MTEVQMNTRQVGQLSLGGRRKEHYKILGAITIAVVLVFAGCAGPAKTTTTRSTATTSTAAATSTAASTKPATSATSVTTSTTLKPTTSTGPYGQLAMASSTFAQETLDPIKASTGRVALLLAPMFDFLFKGGSDAKLVAGLVERWEIAPDGLSWTYYIRKGVKFHNGDTLTAADVKFSLDRYSSKDTLYTDLANMVNRVDTLDDYAVRIHTRGPQPFLPYVSWNISTMLGAVMPKNYIEAKGLPYFTSAPVGTGPFKFLSQTVGDSVRYEANTSYWGQPPVFDKLSVVLAPEEGTRVAMLKTGAADIIDVGTDAGKQVVAAGFRTVGISFNYPMVNLYGAYSPAAAGMPISDIRVRQALSLAIDRSEIMKTFFYGTASPPPPPTISQVSEGIDYAYWMDYSSKIYRYDAVEAKRLLNEAGYANGFNIKFYSFTMTGASFNPALAQIIQGYWLRIGVKAEIVPTAQETFRPLSDTYTSTAAIGQAAIFRYPGGRPVTARELRAVFHSTANVIYHMLDKTNPEFDRLMDSALSEMDATKRSQMLAKALKIATDSYTVLNICGVPSIVAIGPRVDFDSPPHWSAALGDLSDIKHRQQ